MKKLTGQIFMKSLLALASLLILLTGCQNNQADVSVYQLDVDEQVSITPKNTNQNSNHQSGLIFPVKQFRARITKKPFGIYITPESSPVQPERFEGYHTGVDVEYTDTAAEVKVTAISAGQVLFVGWVNGYGGVVVINHNLNGQDYQVLYGHLDPDILIGKNVRVKAGQLIGILGQGGTSQTDGERKHLHFSVYTGKDLNFKGYVSAQQELGKWVDPMLLFSD